MALSNSATDQWYNFDIDRCIVVEDFETNVLGTYDFIDEKDYSVTRKTDYIPIPHTDGSGMISPEISKKNFMIRLPWVKGLLGSFDFKRFIIENNCSPVIKDIYGKEYNILVDNIQIIFTKSQFKLWKYYSSWEQYKTYFKEYNCQACICKPEEDYIKNAKINYQMLQTLTDITDEEINTIAKKSVNKITNVCTSEKTMLDILGVNSYNSNKTAFQKSLKIYPTLISDTYAKDIIREVKNSLLKKYRSGKLEISGKYTFVLPDFYAACEFWFMGKQVPDGLLKDQEVFCNLYKNTKKLDCLRSPHLYKEHAIRTNIACKEFGERSEYIRSWFTTNGIYTSTYDLITKILQLDVDGDTLLVVADTDFVAIAEKNMKDVVPLYYDMKKANAVELNNKTIYAGLNSAFTHGNIGPYSNNISKIWNSEIFQSGTEKEKQDATTIVKLLCMENNYCIDSAKTLYMPTRIGEFGEKISEYTNCKLPAFFEFAKDKDKSQIENRNNSLVNKLYNIIPNKPINTRGLKLGKIDYKLMMSNSQTKCSKKVQELYNKLNGQYRHMINMKDEYIDNLRYVACQLREEFSKTGYFDETICDMLVEYLYGHNKRYKQLLWFLYGEYIYNNLKEHLEIPKTKIIQCIDCGEYFEVGIKNTKSCRCEYCQHEYIKLTDRIRKQK